MGLFGFLRGADINEGMKQYKNTKDAKLIDVRDPNEFVGGHIPESVNVPLGSLQKIKRVVPNKSTPLFVYCLSGARSRTAVSALVKMGYESVTDIGGIAMYKGELE